MNANLFICCGRWAVFSFIIITVGVRAHSSGMSERSDRSCQLLFGESVEFGANREGVTPQLALLPMQILNIQLDSSSESHAFSRAGVALEGRFDPKFVSRDGHTLSYEPSGKPVLLAGVEYIEFPNSTAMTTTSARGGRREFILTRGVKPYLARINEESGAIDPKGYISDVLLFERVRDQYVFRSRLLASNEQKRFFFEDPRISVLYFDGQAHYFLSGTDYSSHVIGSSNLDVMNRYVELLIDENGLPIAPSVNAKTGKPEFKDLSPAPKKTVQGYSFVDAKNGTIAQNELGQIVVRTRMRPDFADNRVHYLLHRSSFKAGWKYAEQIFVFSDWAQFQKYDWNNALDDLFEAHNTAKSDTASRSHGRVRPVEVSTILTDRDLKEHLSSHEHKILVAAEKGKGLGPGTRPLRIRREGVAIYISDAPGAPELWAGQIPKERANHFIIDNQKTIYITFDHEIRYLNQVVNGHSLYRRHYSASLKLFDASLTKLIGYRADIIQPVTALERGQHSGILDLQHVYPMGWTIQPLVAGVAKVRVYAGASDAHTTVYDFDILKLLLENSMQD
jgi:hypothetical protein